MRIGLWGMLLIVVAGCLPSQYVVQGDRASQAEDWKTAEQNYKQALAEKPDDSEIRRKYEAAKQASISQSLLKGQSCLERRDDTCALEEADYVIVIDPENQSGIQLALDAKALRAERVAEAAKARTVIRERETLAALEALLQQARRGEYLAAMRAFEAHGASSDSEKAKSRRTAIRNEVVSLATERVQLLIATSKGAALTESYAALAEASELLSLIGTEESLTLLRTLKGDFEHVKFEYARQRSSEAEALIGNGGWTEAAKLLADASAADPKLKMRARYAMEMSSANSTLAARDYEATEAALNRAIASAPRMAKEARAMLTRVLPKHYRITLESVAVSPVRPGTNPPQPWVGKPDGTFGSVAMLVVGAATGGVGIPLAVKAKSIADQLEKISYNFHPNVRIQLALPDGRLVSTQHDRTLFKRAEASFVAKTNYYDSRLVTLAVFHELDKEKATIGTVQVSLGDLVSGKPIRIANDGHNGLLHVQFRAIQEDVGVGTTSGWAYVQNPNNRVSKVVQSPPGGLPFKLTNAHLQLAKGQADDPFLKIRQGGDIIFKSHFREDDRDTTWTPNWIFYVKPGETIIVEVWDRETIGANKKLLEVSLSAARLRTGQVATTLADGSKLELGFESIETGPQ